MPIIQGDIAGMDLEETERAINTLQGYRSYLQMFGTQTEVDELDKEAVQLEEQRKRLVTATNQPVGEMAAVGSAESNTDNDPNAGSKTTSKKSS